MSFPFSRFSPPRRVLFVLLFLGLALLLVGGGLLGVSDLLANYAMTVPSIAYPRWTPAEAEAKYETWSVTASDGVHLKGWWVPITEGKVTPPTVLIVHGLGARKEHMSRYITLAHEAGYPVLAIDLRSHGESDAGPTTLGYREPLDVLAWLGKLQEEGEFRVILWGTSLGAVTSLRGAAEAQKEKFPIQMAGVISDAPFDTLLHTLANHAKLLFQIPSFPLVPLTEWQIRRRFGFEPKEVDATEAARGIEAPILILAAGLDARMPLPQVRAIYDAAAGPKEFYLIPGEIHEIRRFAPEFREKVTAFLARCSAPEAEPLPIRTAGTAASLPPLR